jgi:hypothetical protein
MSALQLFALALLAGPPRAEVAHTVVLVVIDGLRPAEVFTGAEQALLGPVGGVENEEGLKARYWRESPEARREALMPFLWGTVVPAGQLFGASSLASPARVENGARVSYPGYNELLTGVADPRITSNEYPANPNVTVFEWLAAQQGFAGQVQAFATWDTFIRIFNVERSGLDVRAGWNPPFEAEVDRSPAKDTLDQLFRTTTPMFGGNALDALTYAALKESLKTRHPRALFLGLGETDEWMHAGRYDVALEVTHRADALIADLWNTLQAMPEYRGTTTFIITTDHGRGHGPVAWRDHGAEIDGAEEVWLAALGPGVPPLGVRSSTGLVTQAQVAATLASLLGLDWKAQNPGAGLPLPLAPDLSRQLARGTVATWSSPPAR